MQHLRLNRSAIAVCCLAVFLVACGEKSDDDLLRSAQAALTKRELSAASVELRSLLQRTPGNGTARLLLGQTLLDQGEPQAASLELARAHDAGVDENLWMPLLARAWLESGKARELLRVYGDTTLSVPTARADLRTAIAGAMLILGRKAEAQVAIAQVLQDNPNHAGALLLKAKQAGSEARFDEALSLSERAQQPDADNGEVHMLRGMIFRFGKKDSAAAVKEFELAAKDARTLLGARTALIQLNLAQNRVADAKDQLAQLEKVYPKHGQTLFLQASVAYVDRDFARTESIAAELLRHVPDNPRLLVLGGAASLQSGNLLVAETRLGKVVQTVAGATTARKLLAETYIRLGQPEKALHTLSPLLDSAAGDGEALALAGQASLQAGRIQDSEQQFTAAARLRPNDIQIKTALALTDLVKGKADDAIETLQTLAARDPGQTADQALIGTYMRRGEFDAAITAIQKLQRKQPAAPEPLQLLGLALRAKGDLPGARDAFERALKLAPRYQVAALALAQLDVDEGKLDAAQQRLTAVIRANPKSAVAHMAMLELAKRREAKPAEQLAIIDEALRLTVNEAAPHIAKIAHLMAANDPKSAANAAQVALAQVPSDPRLLDAAGEALAAAGDLQQAVSVYNKLASLYPRSALAHLRIADLHERRGDLNAAQASVARALEAEPLAASVHQRLLQQAIGTRDTRQVLTTARELQRRFPDSAQGYLLQGDLALARKEWAAAQAAYRSALNKPGAGSKPQIRLYITLVAGSSQAAADQFAIEWRQRHPKDAEFLAHLGSAALARKDMATAEQRFREVLSIYPDSVVALNNLAWLVTDRSPREAVGFAERALALSPQAAPVLDTLAKALAADGQLQRAISVQGKAIAASPGRQSYQLQLARLHLQAGNKTQARSTLDGIDALPVKDVPADDIGTVRKAIGAA